LPLTLSVVLSAALAAQASAAPEARRYRAERCGISVASPFKLSHERRALAVGGSVDLYTGEGGGVTFRMSCARDDAIHGPSEALFATYRDAFTDHDPERLISERPITLDSIEGRELQEEAPDGTHSLGRVYIGPKVTFIVLVSGSLPAIASDDAVRFLDSLRVEKSN